MPAFSVSDFEFYIPFSDEASGFLASVMVNEVGNKIGIMVFHFRSGLIDNIMQKNMERSKTGETYIIGADLRMRSTSILAEENTILKDQVKTKQTLLWQILHFSVW